MKDRGKTLNDFIKYFNDDKLNNIREQKLISNI